MYLSEIIIVFSQSYIHSPVNLLRFSLLIKLLKFKYRRLCVLAKKKTGRGCQMGKINYYQYINLFHVNDIIKIIYLTILQKLYLSNHPSKGLKVKVMYSGRPYRIHRRAIPPSGSWISHNSSQWAR